MWIKRVICILLVVLCLPFSGCSAIGTGEVRAHTENYDILIRDGKWYLYLSKETYEWCRELRSRVIHEEGPWITPDGEVTSTWRGEYLYFDSVQQMRQAFLTGNISRKELYTLTYNFDDFVRVDREVEMIDLDNMYVPVVPEGVTLGRIEMVVPYTFEIKMEIAELEGKTSGRESAYISYWGESWFDSEAERCLKLYDKRRNEFMIGPQHITRYSESIDTETGLSILRGRQLDSQIDANETIVRYAINANVQGYYVKKEGYESAVDGTLYVIVNYFYDEFEDPVNPAEMFMSCPTGGIEIHFSWVYPKERDVEWLSQFGFEPYVGP